MKVRRAVITAASPQQRNLPLQTVVDRDGRTRSILKVIIDEARSAGIEEIAVVVCPGDEENYRRAVEEEASQLHFIPQQDARGYGHALFCAHSFVDDQPFLHMVGDHIYVSGEGRTCAQQVVDAAQTLNCAVSGVQATRESLLSLFGAVGGRRVGGAQNLFTIERVVEKPTPTEAEQTLLVPGLRQGNYLCFFGIHVLTPTVMQLLHDAVAGHQSSGTSVQLSPVLNELAKREAYQALETQGKRYPIDVRYGLLSAQLALGLSGQEREEVLALLCEMLAQRQSLQTPLSAPQTVAST